MESQPLSEISSLRELKKARQELKKNRHPQLKALLEKRIKAFQEKHMIKANHEATNRIIKFLSKVVK